ncbi:MAG: hypothetical protein EXR11_09650 [Rhodospirillaceae bacterium]|nr:hypothetical protein [Rhodospirillaceae bacterium]
MTNVADQGMKVPSRKTSARACMGATVILLALSACVTDLAPSFPEPFKIDKKNQDRDAVELVQADLGASRDKFSAEPGLTTPMGRTLAEPYSSAAPPSLKGDKISVNFEGLRLAAFANTVFGELLNVTFEIDNAVQQREQLVTLRTAEPLDPNQFLAIVRQVLGNYGISIIYQNNVYRIVESAAMRQDIPRIIRSRALPNIPNDMRPVFYYAALRAIHAGAMQSWLQQSLKDRLQYQTLPLLNGLLLLGKMEDIEAAKETIDVLDQPALAGSKSMRVSPAFWSAERMATQLVEVLTAEGYSVGVGGNISTSIKIVPVKALNILIIFCADETVMQHTLAWAADLDQPGQTIETKGIFYHPVYNTKAKDLAEVIETLLGGGPANMTGGIRPTSANGMTSPANSSGSNSGTGTAEQRGTGEARKVIVDEGRNALIFQGTPEEYSQFRTLVDQMDRAPLEVLIEATVAEVTLKQGETLGAVLEFDDGVSAAVSRSAVRSSDGLLVSLVRDTGQFKANLKALADKSRVNILSNPRVVASSGKPASIQIGTQVPIITTQQTSPTGTVGGTSALLQDIQYRSTGVSLRINPTINSSRRVELEVSQEVSEAQTNNVSNVQSPLILTRNIQTTLSINDGETVMLGGLISENVSKSENGIPLLMDIPVLGNIFKMTSRGRNRTELIILITPYIIESAETARTLRDAFRERLTGLPSVQGVELNTPAN